MKTAPKKESSKRSLRAKLVARAFYENVRKGRKQSFKEIALAQGYAPSTVAANKVQMTKSYQEEIAPRLALMQRILDKAYKALEAKEFAPEKAIDIANISKIVSHDVALLQGRSTENIAQKTEVVVYSDTDPLAKQLNKAI